HRHRLAVLALSALLLAASAASLAAGGSLQSYQVPKGTTSGEASRLIDEQLGGSEATFVVLLSHPTLTWRDSAFRGALLAAVEPLRSDERVADVLTPYDVPASEASALLSRDGRRAMVVVTMVGELPEARDAFPEVREKLRSPALDVMTTDRVAVYSEMQQILDEDLKRSEAIALPFVLLLLLVVFGSVLAALLPLGVGLLAVAGGVAGVMLASRFTDMSLYAMNIVTLIGLGVAIDYSLFIVNRFREEMHAGLGTEEALARTLATAGRATAFSGLTVAVGLAGLAFYRGLYFASIGIAGAIVVTLAVLYALTFLPAILSLLGPRIDRFRVPLPRRRRGGDFWGGLARRVMRRPLLFLVPTLALILIAGSPFLHLRMASGGLEMLPPDAESRRAWDILRAEFPEGGLNVVSVVIEYPGDPLSRERVGALHDLVGRIEALEGVSSVASIVSLDGRLTRADYESMYAQPRSRLPPPVQEAVNRSVGASIVVVSVSTRAPEASAEARELVRDLRALDPPGDGRLLVTGPTAIDVDTVELVHRHTPAAVAFIVVTTYLLLLVQTGSVLLPLKAIVMNVLSIVASFGALVWIFQDGNLSALLGFTPAPIDPSLPVLLFCIVFGLSMDYEVLLLSRIHEEHEATGDNTQAVANGLAKTGRLITSAAAIMVLVFGAFALAQVTIIKAIGLGLALAILIDATIVRALIVPSTMRLMGDLNWWAPAWMRKLLRPMRH
ncbi:MAG TPA: MMPL family transporter, partial [Candidatus Thermoplasmatota archaeon]|nr:MMPL family transporter [Candidatus Thermoplasmatota archaeon]